eukprot:COSAG03_NODE_3194_length_2151_cov_2.395224_1_plen_112_part_00
MQAGPWQLVRSGSRSTAASTVAGGGSTHSTTSSPDAARTFARSPTAVCSTETNRLPEAATVLCASPSKHQPLASTGASSWYEPPSLCPGIGAAGLGVSVVGGTQTHQRRSS